MKVIRTSQFSGKENTMDLPTVTQERLDQCWSQNVNRQGRHVQDVFPELSADEREFLITGCTPQEWEEMFGDRDEEGEDL